MLPSDLLNSRKYRDTIRPVYAKINHENLTLADRVISAYHNHLNKVRGKLLEAIKELEGSGYDYRFVRGISTLLERRSNFEIEAYVKPEVARDRLFHVASERGIPTKFEKRRMIMIEEAAHLGVSVEELEQSLYADLEEEQVLRDFKPIGPEELVKQYNLGQTQTLLFKASMMEFTASGNWQQIFRWIKWLGLIYTIHKDVDRGGEGYRVRVDGPISLFKLNHRYGTSMAKLLPHIIASRDWSLHALILRQRSDRMLLNLNLDSRRHGRYLKTLISQGEEYDSFIEENFAKRFEALKTGWKMTREPSPLPVGTRVMIPDFLFEKSGMRVYLEVAGFWTPEYLRHKLGQLREVEGIDMIVAADRRHACNELDRMSSRLNILYYKSKVPLQPIYQHLREREAEMMKKQLEELEKVELKVDNPVMQASELAEKLGVLEETVQQVFRDRQFPGYELLGDTLITRSKLDNAAERLEEGLKDGGLTLNQASELLEELDIPRPVRVLEHLGYRIEWHGINPDEASIQKTKKNS
jgi:predicted nuclease of restriction endonuclease-like RecB superfamily